MAKKGPQANKQVAAGHDLEAAADALAAAYTCSDKPAPQETLSAVTDAQRAAATLLASAGQRASGSPSDDARTASEQQDSSQQASADGQPQDPTEAVQQLSKAIDAAAQQVIPNPFGDGSKPNQG
ncbi:MAG TPA: hypothetical protein VK324_11405 [Tepidisphaeraceae bacterium]|nr:hypothetical protein [Tepidisphaeraceae bacterium]